MNPPDSTVDTLEVDKFGVYEEDWWDKDGPLKTLHDINETRLEFIRQHSSLEGKRVLDVGCGGGILSEAMSQASALVTGIDAQGTAIEIACRHAQDNQLVIDYHCTPVEDFESKPFDVITCMELLEHVHNPILVLEHCKRLLKPGGLLFLSTISRTLKAYTHAIIAAEYLLNIVPRQTHDYSKFIKPSELVAMARAFELNLIDLKGMNYNPFSRKASLSSDVSVNYMVVFEA